MALVLPLERRSWLLGGGPPLLRGLLRHRRHEILAGSTNTSNLLLGERANLGQHAQGLIAGIVVLGRLTFLKQIHVEHEQCAGTADL
jgi:hypothetical protein